jgi:hypothetical protein
MLNPTESPRCLHHARPATGHDRPAKLGEAATYLARFLVHRAAFPDAGRAEDRHRGLVDLVDCLETLTELLGNERDVLLEVFGPLLGGEDPSVFHQKLRGTCVACMPSTSRAARPKYRTPTISL